MMMKSIAGLFTLLVLTMELHAADLDYPERYQALELPQYENATVTDLGRDSSSLSSGITITLFTTDGSDALRAFYEEAMQALGWELQETIASKKMRAAGVLDTLPFGAVFGKDSMRYQIFTGSKDNGTSIRINLLED